MVSVSPPPWLDNEEQQERLTSYAEAVNSYFGDEYELKTVDVSNEIEAERAVGQYNGRDGEKVSIDLLEDCNLYWDWNHELGHDAAGELVMDAVADRGLLPRRTFDESFAYLTEMTIRDEEQPRPGRRDIFNHGSPAAWETLREALEPDKRETEQHYLEMLEEPLDEEDWRQVSNITQQLERVAPDTGIHNMPFHRDELYQENMFLANLPAGDITAQKRALKDMAMMRSQYETARAVNDWTLEKMVVDAYTSAHENDYPVQKAIGVAARDMMAERMDITIEKRDDEDLSKFMERMQEQRIGFIENHAYDILEHGIQETVTSLQESVAEYQEELASIDSREEYVLDAIRHEDYGDTIEGVETGYDEFVDIPHRLGTELAETYYQLDIEPLDLVADPETYMETTEKAIMYTIQTWLDEKDHSRERMVAETGLGDPDDLGEQFPQYSTGKS
ncbi:MAG: hypothetical protein SVU32_04545 [Candidatus Nanohaloarchaea archaeon]|nr:hypothetical protein [Candidatus Nanohaloarchaea archaeon]